ncbi:MAG: peptidoglycan-binding domain-containing protein, partial [Candidatus Solibacter sp.]|nr:peptidoglycan-binding domain-containing protein [Candidatus Solibacter sp.]
MAHNSKSEGQKASTMTLGEAITLTKNKPDVPTSAGLKQGDKGDNVAQLQAYLAKFGYMASPAAGVFGLAPEGAPAAPKGKTGTFDDQTAQALRRFQEFNHLPVTGELDEDTVAMMHRP